MGAESQTWKNIIRPLLTKEENIMNKLIENLANLVKVKTLVTMAVCVVFAVLALKGTINADNVMIIVSMVVSFYFGTQHEKTT